MIIPVTSIEQAGPGIDLSDQPEGVAVEMSDPVPDFEYARNAVTLTFDLSGVEHVRLAFEALEYGDEPHSPPPGPFGDGVNFDGVAVSCDGVNWYEIQDLRHLRSDKYTAFDLDLDALVGVLGLSYNGAFRVRFCQYDDNPAPMDGFSIRGIRLTGDLRPVVLHLPMNDSAATATVADVAAGHHDQVFVDPGGNPNTSAHTVAGRVGTALSFDGVDDRIIVRGVDYRQYLDANRNFTITLWWKTNNPDPAATLYFLVNRNDLANSLFLYTNGTHVYQACRFVSGAARWVSRKWSGGADGNWHHYAFVRKGTVISLYRDAVLGLADSNPDNAQCLAPADRDLSIGAYQTGGNPSPGIGDDFRLYDRALLESEIVALAAGA